MKELTINASSHSYEVSIGEGLRFQIHQFLKKNYSSIFIITDDTVAKWYLEDVSSNFVKESVHTSIIPSGEKSKNIDIFYRLQTEALTFGLDRDSLIIALGGGVVGDLAGFIAATFMRGVDYIQVPTTILAHDSSVGGKVAINHELGKNLIGSFYPPIAVIYDVDTLSTLSNREIRSGYAEIIKEALISNESAFQELLDLDLRSISNESLKKHLSFGIQVKASIVEADEKEKSMRKFLNLGHTLGHAIEAEAKYNSITHGEAVAIGLLFALYISEDLYQKSLSYDPLKNWLLHNKYPIDIQYFQPENLLKRMKSDKKTANGEIQMVLLKKIGEPVLRNMQDDEIISYLEQFSRKLVLE